MKITKKIFGISLLPLILLLIGTIVSGVIIYSSNTVTKEYINEYVERQRRISEIYQLLGYGGGIHAFKNYILRNETKYKKSASNYMSKAIVLIEEYKQLSNLSNEEIQGMSILEKTISEYKEKLLIAEEMISNNSSKEQVDIAVKVDDTPAVNALKNLQNYFSLKSKQELLKLKSSQETAFNTIFTFFIFSLLLSLLMSRAISKKIINSINKLLFISNEISSGNFLIEREKVSNLAEDELKTIANQMISTGDRLNTTFSKLESSNEELTNFAFAASHDLQEPIKKIFTYVELLELEIGVNLKKEALFYMSEIKNSSSRMIKLIKALLNYSQVNPSKMKLEVVDLNNIVDICKKNLEASIKEVKGEVKVSNLPTVHGSQELLQSLFQNLISNSIKYRNKNTIPIINISAKKSKGNSWYITVEDNGIGFNIKYLETALRPFGRVHSKEDYPGLGIGLALCKKIVEFHGSKLSVQSTEGIGSQFSFSLKV